MKIEFLPPARAELTDVISYYNKQSEGLGYEFTAEIKRTLERIVQYPDAWFKLSKRTRAGSQKLGNHASKLRNCNPLHSNRINLMRISRTWSVT